MKRFENETEYKYTTKKNENPEIITNCNSTTFGKKSFNNYDKRYQSCCIDDTTNGTLLFNNTEAESIDNVGQKKRNVKSSTIKSFLPIDSSSDEEVFKVPETKRLTTRRNSKTFKKEGYRDNTNKLKGNTSENLNVTEKGNNTKNQNINEDSLAKTYNTTNSQQTTLGLYSEFRNEYENLLDGNKILGDVSSSYNNKSNNQHLDEHKSTKVKKTDKVQPSPIPKENCTEIIDINSDCFTNLYSVGKKNVSTKYNRLTLAEQLEITFRKNKIPINDRKNQNLDDQFNHTYRKSLEETIPNLKIKCLANSTFRDESSERTFYADEKSKKLQTPYLSRTFVKNLGYSSVPSETERNETLFMQQQFLLDNNCSTEMVRHCENSKTQTAINTPTIISDLGIKKSEFTSENNMITTTNTQDIYSIDDDNETKSLKNSNTTNETFTETIKQVNETIDMATKTYNNSTVVLQETQQLEKKSYIDPSIIDDFRDEMIQSINDVCDFLSQKVKNNTAINLVEERFMENAKFLYKFFFHSCREVN